MYKLKISQQKFLMFALDKHDSGVFKLSQKCRNLFQFVLMNNHYYEEHREELAAYTKQIMEFHSIKYEWEYPSQIL
jgi:hypothetical protein